MAEQALNLWPPDIGTVDVVTPREILRQQAALLAERTKGVLEAEVTTSSKQGGFEHSFSIVAPAIDNYRYHLFAVRHGVDLYPVRPLSGTELNTEAEFVEWLRQELTSEKTRRVIVSLLAMSKQ